MPILIRWARRPRLFLFLVLSPSASITLLVFGFRQGFPRWLFASFTLFSISVNLRRQSLSFLCFLNFALVITRSHILAKRLS